MQDFKIPNLKSPKNKTNSFVVGILMFAFVFGFAGGLVAFYSAPVFSDSLQMLKSTFAQTEQQNDTKKTSNLQAGISFNNSIVSAVEQSSPSVVSVVATKDLPVIERFLIQPFEFFPDFKVPQYRSRGTQPQQVSAGTGFVAQQDIIITNRHVVEDVEANYTIITNEGDSLEAQVLSRHTEEDLAVLSVQNLNINPLPLADSDNLKLGSGVIAIGNALGEFKNSVSAGVISGLSRTIYAQDGQGQTEILSQVIQTDAAINFGNSGGPLLNINGEVIGVNVAKAAQAENIGFAIPINRVKTFLAEAILSE